MIELKNNQFLIDGRPRLILSGEIHYFRLPVAVWEERIIQLKKSGCNTCSTYIPWIAHEYYEGYYDFGEKNENLNLQLFIELCKKHDMFFIARPGPFTMAEIKNEGIPYWVYESYPQVIPETWEHKEVVTKTLDYSHPDFLKLIRGWYKQISLIIKPYLYQNSGNVIAFQLDNEVGMLSWVSNSPDLTKVTMTLFSEWLKKKYDPALLTNLYPEGLSLLEKHNVTFFQSLDETSCQIWKDLGYFMRWRFKEYLLTLEKYAKENGIRQIPFIVNIHGTSQSRGLTFPIGISQLYDVFSADEQIIPGTDLYFGDLDVKNFHDLYVVNAYTKAIAKKDQPIGCMEFNCGDGNFGDNYGERYDVSATDLKLRMSLAQGNRLINYYLFTGGFNYELPEARGDGNDRIGFTGERHGFAAPISPEGEETYTYPRLQEVTQRMMLMENKLSEMKEETDGVSIAFIPDYFMTEYHTPNQPKLEEMLRNIEGYRNTGMWDSVIRSLLLANVRMDAIDIQNDKLSLNKTKLLIVGSASYMSEEIQEKLSLFMTKGGKVLLYGMLPEYNMDGESCTILRDNLKISSLENISEKKVPNLSLVHQGWAHVYPEFRSWYAQVYGISENSQEFLREKTTHKTCGAVIKYGEGECVLLTTQYRGDKDFYLELLKSINIEPALKQTFKEHGIFMTSTINDSKERFLHVLNLDGFDKEFEIIEKNSVLFDNNPIYLMAKRGLLLPINLSYSFGEIVHSTAELIEILADKLVIATLGNPCWIRIKTDKKIVVSKQMTITKIAKNELIIYFEKSLEKQQDIIFG